MTINKKLRIKKLHRNLKPDIQYIKKSEKKLKELYDKYLDKMTLSQRIRLSLIGKNTFYDEILYKHINLLSKKLKDADTNYSNEIHQFNEIFNNITVNQKLRICVGHITKEEYLSLDDDVKEVIAQLDPKYFDYLFDKDYLGG